MPDKSLPIYNFTLKHGGISHILHSPIKISLLDDISKSYETRGIWDTGATNTVISQKVVEVLELKPSGIAEVNTASETGLRRDTYITDIFLGNLRIRGVEVTVGKILQSIDCLIGMDIITLGDFSVTNYQNKTCMSFRVPSLHEIDYIQEAKKAEKQSLKSLGVGRNDPCPCGSGKKFKKCHGRFI